MNGLQKGLAPKPKRKPVTLIIGIICQDGVVIAADSQTTWGSKKSWDARKMTGVQTPKGGALVAESGAGITSQKAVEGLQKLCQDTTFFNDRGMPEAAEKAIRDERARLRSVHFDCTSEKLQEIIRQEELNCALMIAHRDDEAVRIDTIDLLMAIPQRSRRVFEAIGSGSDLATYLLGDLCEPGMSFAMAALIAVRVVEIVKANDTYCGGPTRLGLIRLSGPSTFTEVRVDNGAPVEHVAPVEYVNGPIVGEQSMSEIIKMVQETEIQIKKQRGALVRRALERLSRKVSFDEPDKIKYYCS